MNKDRVTITTPSDWEIVRLRARKSPLFMLVRAHSHAF